MPGNRRVDEHMLKSEDMVCSNEHGIVWKSREDHCSMIKEKCETSFSPPTANE